MIKDNLFGFGNTILNFNTKNVSMNIQEANFYGNDGTSFYLSGTLSICNEKFKKIKKESKSILPILKQFDFFISNLGISHKKLSHPSYEVMRASKGIKTIKVKYLIEDPIYAYGLGANLDRFRGYAKVDLDNLKISERIRNCEEMMCGLISYNDEKSLQARQISLIENKEFHEIWKNNFSNEWKVKLDLAKKEGISYHKLKDYFNINQYRVAS